MEDKIKKLVFSEDIENRRLGILLLTSKDRNLGIAQLIEEISKIIEDRPDVPAHWRWEYFVGGDMQVEKFRKHFYDIG